jgi:hypothetical protein
MARTKKSQRTVTAFISWFLFYLDLLLRGKDVDEPEGRDRGRVNGG